MYLASGTVLAIGSTALAAPDATFEFDGSTSLSWHVAANWTLVSGSDGDGIPDPGDAVIIPDPGTDFVVAVTAAAGAYSLDLQGGSDLALNSGGAPYTFTLGNGATVTSFVDDLNGLSVNWPSASMTIDGIHTIAGLGSALSSILFEDVGTVTIATGDQLILDAITMSGEGNFTGAGELELQADAVVTAVGGTMDLGPSLNLSDAAGAKWQVEGGNTLQFRKVHTGANSLVGNLFLSGNDSKVAFTASVNFDSTFTWNSGTVADPSVLFLDYDGNTGNITFSYDAFEG
ncbi:MAG: hypothetical protein ACREJT_14260, partial [Myxococcota bacterium]